MSCITNRPEDPPPQEQVSGVSGARINDIHLPQDVMMQLREAGETMHSLSRLSHGTLQHIRAKAADGRLIEDKDGTGLMDMLELTPDEAQDAENTRSLRITGMQSFGLGQRLPEDGFVAREMARRNTSHTAAQDCSLAW